MKTLNYFAYGSNMDAERMKKRNVKFLSRYRGILKGWRLEFNKVALKNEKEGYANIVPDENSYVEGCVYEIEDRYIEELDKHEAYPDHYERKYVIIETEKGEIKAITYIANASKLKKGLMPSKEYLSYLLKGKDCLSDEYFEKLSLIKTLD
ncbi:MAG TPA: gamma-glutamylcyclotransferase [Elusimicrobiales bacterium]|nr:gamma-glutamylcyclotransferase [Elusimicrobiales bacterium]HOL62384.1 gamma-glutamylcyclotransferase [Elusimicrobiales bacterium]